VNQGIAFARTIRALDADDFRASKLGLLVAAVVLVAWTWWMLAARVPQYESTSNVRIESDRVIAYFPPDVLSLIHADQPARITINGVSLPAQVQTVASDHVELVLAPNPQSPIPASSSASADIETTRVAPAALALRTLGRARR
jgi:hypothetical protein